MASCGDRIRSRGPLDLELQGEVEVLLWLIQATIRATGPLDVAVIDAVLFADREPVADSLSAEAVGRRAQATAHAVGGFTA